MCSIWEYWEVAQHLPDCTRAGKEASPRSPTQSTTRYIRIQIHTWFSAREVPVGCWVCKVDGIVCLCANRPWSSSLSSVLGGSNPPAKNFWMSGKRLFWLCWFVDIVGWEGRRVFKLSWLKVCITCCCWPNETLLSTREEDDCWDRTVLHLSRSLVEVDRWTPKS